MKKSVKAILAACLVLSLILVPLLVTKNHRSGSQDNVESILENDANDTAYLLNTNTEKNIIKDSEDANDRVITREKTVKCNVSKTEEQIVVDEDGNLVVNDDANASFFDEDNTTLLGVSEQIEEKTDEEMLTETKQIIVSAAAVSEEDKDKIVDIIGDLAILEYDSVEAVFEAFDNYQNDENAEAYAPKEMHAFDNGKNDYDPLSWGYDAINAGVFNQALIKKYGSIESIPEVIVGIIDTGVDYNHEFLKGRVVKYDSDFVDRDGDAMDEHSHGTHVAGIITDSTLANVKIYAYRVLDADGEGTDASVAQAIKKAANDGVDVINLSLGGGHSALIDEALDYAVSKNVIPAIAAGNDAIDASNECPAHYHEALTVAAMASKSKIAYYSNYGWDIDISAPGSNINSSVPNGEFESKSGTSMATPFVAGAAASLKAYLNDSDYDYLTIEKILKDNVTDIGTPGFDTTFGYGLLNMETILSSLTNEGQTIKDVTKEPSINITFNGENTATVADSLSLEITAEEGATIYYTIDGSMPAVDGTNASTMIYSGKQTYNQIIKVVAIAKHPDKYVSDFARANGYLVKADYDYVITSDGMIEKYTGKEKILHIPEKIAGIEVHSLGYEFLYGTSVTEVYVPDTVTTLCNMSFNSFCKVEKIHLGKNVQYVGTAAVKTGLSELTIDPENTYLIADEGALYSKDYVYLFSLGAYKGNGEYAVSDKCKYIVIDALYDENIAKVQIPTSVEDIFANSNIEHEEPYYYPAMYTNSLFEVAGNNQYYSSENDVLYNKDKTEVYGFYNKSRITHVVLNDSVKYINEYAFYNCLNLSKIDLSQNLTDIDRMAFYNSNISELIIPKSVSHLSYGTLSGNKEGVLYFDGDCPEYLYDVNYGEPVKIYKYKTAKGFETGLETLKKCCEVTVYDRETGLRYSTTISVSIPDGFDTDYLFLDGKQFKTEYDENTGTYSVDSKTSTVSTVVAYKNNGEGLPRTLHIWNVTYSDFQYELTELAYEITEEGELVNYSGQNTILHIPEMVASIPVNSIGEDFLQVSLVTEVYIPVNVIKLEDGCFGSIDGISVYFDGNCPAEMGNINNGKRIDLYIYPLAKGFDEAVLKLRESGEVNVFYRDADTTIAVAIPDGFDTSKLYLNGVEYATEYDEESGLYSINPGTIDIQYVTALKTDSSMERLHVWNAHFNIGSYAIDDTFCEVSPEGEFLSYTGISNELHIPEQLASIEIKIISYYLNLSSTVEKIYLPDSVTTIESGSLESYYLKEIYIGKNVRYIGTQPFRSKVNKITVDPDNDYLIEEDGALYTSDYEYLFTLAGFKGTEYFVHEGTKYIVRNAEYGTSIATMYLPDSVCKINSDSNFREEHKQWNGPKRRCKYIVGAGNEYYSSDDKYLYNKAKTTLVLYFGEDTDENLIIPDTVKVIGEDAFYLIKLNQVTFPQGLERIENAAFFHTGIESFVIPSTVTCLAHTSLFTNKSISVYFDGDCPKKIGAFNYDDPITIYRYPWAKGFEEALPRITGNGSEVTILNRETNTSVFVTIPNGYDTDNIYLNGVAYPATYDAKTGKYYADNGSKIVKTVGIRKSTNDVDSFHWFTAEYVEDKYTVTDTDFETTLTGVFTAYTGSNSVLIIPEDVAGITITEVASDAKYSVLVTEIYIPDSVTTLGNNSLSSKNLKAVHIGKNVKTIGTKAFGSNISKIYLDQENPYYIEENGALYSKKYETLYTLTAVSSEEYTIHEGCVTVLSGAGNGSGIKTVYIPTSVKELQDDCFANGSNLTMYFDGDCPETVGAINSENAVIIYRYPWTKGFDESKLTALFTNYTIYNREYNSKFEVTLPDEYSEPVFSIDGNECASTYNQETGFYEITYDNAQNTSAFLKATIKETEQGIETIENCFWNIRFETDHFEATIIPYFIDETGKITRYFGDETEVIIPSSIGNITVTSIGKEAFKNTITQKVVIADSVETIEDFSFIGLENLSDLYLGKNVSNIGTLMAPSPYLTITVDSENSHFLVYDNVLYDRNYTKIYAYGKHEESEYSLPATIEEIGELAFLGAKNLTNIRLPEGLKTINSFAFSGTGLEELVIPSTVEYMGYGSAFTGEDKTLKLYFKGDCPATLDALNEQGSVDIYKYPLAKGFEKIVEEQKSLYNCTVNLYDICSSTAIHLTIPKEYVASKIYLNGIEYESTYDSLKEQYVVDSGTADISTITVYKLNIAGSPVGMYSWTADYDGEKYEVTPHPELTTIMDYMGFAIRIRGFSGLRYTANIPTDVKQALASEEGYYGFKLKEYGVLALPEYLTTKYPLLLGGEKVRGTVDYKVEADGTVTETLFESKNGFDSFTGLLINIPESGYNTNIAFRSYLILEKDGKTYTFYQKPVARSIYYIAKRYISKNFYKEGTLEYNYLMSIINAVEK